MRRDGGVRSVYVTSTVAFTVLREPLERAASLEPRTLPKPLGSVATAVVVTIWPL
jgi:hypothetical protein